MSVPVASACIWEDSGAVLMARINLDDNTNAQQADITSISLSIRELETKTENVSDLSVAVATVIFDTLQTGGPWTVDETGYNFKYKSLASQVPKGDKTYMFEFKFTPVSGEVFHVVFKVETANLQRS